MYRFRPVAAIVINTVVQTAQRFARLRPLLPVWLVLEFG